MFTLSFFLFLVWFCGSITYRSAITAAFWLILRVNESISGNGAKFTRKKIRLKAAFPCKHVLNVTMIPDDYIVWTNKPIRNVCLNLFAPH